MKRSLKLNALLNSIRSVLNIIFPLMTFPYVSRVLTVSGIGAYNFSNSIVGYFLLLAELGTTAYAIREGSKFRNNQLKIKQFASEVFTINLFSTLISYLLLFSCLIIFVELHNYFVCILIFSLQIFFTTTGVEWIYQIYEDYTFITLRSIIFQILSIVLLFVFVRKSNDYINYALVTVFSTIGSNILNFIYVRKYVKLRLVFHFNWKKHLIPILIIFASNVATMIYVNSDITLLGLLKNDYVVGIYSVSSKIYQIIKTVIAALLVVTVPRLSLLFGQKKVTEYNSLLSKLTNTLLLISLPATTGLFMLAKQVILIISGPHYIRSMYSLRILCLAFIFSIFAWILTACVLLPAKREKKVVMSTVISATLNILINLCFIPFLNENAAAISTVLAEACMFLINYYYAKDIVKNIFISKKLAKTFISSLIGCVGIIVICRVCDLFISSVLLNTFLSVIFSIIVYFIILILLKNETAKSIINSAKMIIIRKLK